MSATVAALWRHPIKGHGREALECVTLTEGRTIPWDRRWAVAHEMSKADGTEWAPCANFSRGAKTGTLMAIAAKVDKANGTVSRLPRLRGPRGRCGRCGERSCRPLREDRS